MNSQTGMTHKSAYDADPRHLAPEMACGDVGKIGPLSDVYLLGAILFEIMTGKRPHGGRDVMDCLVNASNNAIVDAGQAGELAQIALKAVATEPDKALEVLSRMQERPQLGESWTNGLGMTFVPVPGTEVLFCRWETRVKDFEAFVNETGYEVTKGMYSVRKGKWGQYGDTWKNPGFAQDGTHPVCGVSWEDAQAFCKWLTEKERKSGLLKVGQEYRLPKDWEWSVAVGLNEDKDGTPESRNSKIKGVYPWGFDWPPPKDAGNYAGSEAKDDDWPRSIEGFRDGYARTAPVGSFKANKFGIHDLGGNINEWCEDFYNGKSGARVLRGGSWASKGEHLLSSFRVADATILFSAVGGFRMVIGYRQ